MSMPAVERALAALEVLEGAEPVIDMVMPGMLEAMLDMSIDAIDAFLNNSSSLKNIFNRIRSLIQ